MKNKAIRYDAEFKEKALSQLHHGQSTHKLAHQLGISPLTLKRWQQMRSLQDYHLLDTGPLADNQHPDDLQRRIIRLEEGKRVLKEALRILLRTG